ncbi:MAG TPA: hypothetical protein VJ385_20835 [Fibrobacteria bacterium]|nr:hypothetical protein [Fibrobacteria bacterium]
MDFQAAPQTGAFTYQSFARYRGDMSLDLPFGRFTAARDAAHWGPGIFNNLVLNQAAVPFNQYSFSMRLGPIRIFSLYGDLTIGPTQGFSEENLSGRHLYAHRYEWAFLEDWLLGVSEELILHDVSKPYLFTPVFPLFIAKGFMFEESNNGNIAFDMTRRLPGLGLVYTEFLLDDMESPSSLLFKEYAQNKWAWMGGLHHVRDFPWGSTGAILEYSRIEPWVYGHFTPNTTQSANMGYPLGSPAGPNSRIVTAKLYGRFLPSRRLYLGAKSEWVWKGVGPGSRIEDPVPQDPTTPKEFLKGNDSPEFYLEPEAGYAGGLASVGFGGRFGGSTSFWTGIRIAY